MTKNSDALINRKLELIYIALLTPYSSNSHTPICGARNATTESKTLYDVMQYVRSFSGDCSNNKLNKSNTTPDKKKPDVVCTSVK